MLDENLPTFVLKPSKDKPKQLSTFLFAQYGADFEPSYTLRHLDPEQHASRNRYAAALYDAYSSEVLYAEVLLIPEWTQSVSPSNGVVPPPPEPILPSQFSIQLYNPDQQIVVRHKPASFTSAATWEFELPQQTFRAPSASALDRAQHDPTASDITPKVVFKWKKDGKFSKDLACFLAGKSTNLEGIKPKHKEPDITVSIFKGLKELTLYEPNLHRVDIEDMKGFEVVLLLGAVVIRDVYFGSLKETFNISNSGRKSIPSSPTAVPSNPSPIGRQTSTASQHPPVRDPRIPPTDPRSQWEIDSETARLKRDAEQEARELRRRQEEEERQTRKLLEAEEQEQRRRRRAEIDRETEHLRRIYGQEDAAAAVRPPISPRINQDGRHHSASSHSSYGNPHMPGPDAPYSAAWGSYQGPYMTGAAAQSTFLTPGGPTQQPNLKQKSSIFSFRRRSDQDANKLQRKKSAVF
ncbi:hypothetical protein B0A52_06965 [Exophiala mesophila]|uniref:Uncharacterized protein n=1 Tax=Exophiala mesophila TaxID=212818 RepID=A0A438N0Y2_EXOME|nr:hypothetical protein B0A52_06965 [Exophiala mesophila]